MKFEYSKYSKHVAYEKVEFSFGIFYATKYFLLSELNEGIHVDYDIAGQIVSRFSDYIDKGIKICYISNRINSYSIKPQIWAEFNNEYDTFIASAIVTYTDFSYLNASLEKQFFNKSLKRCKSLDEAIEWVMSLEELNQN
ncbi:hypothetical protein HSX10_04215 [Winogradskyella undariae]|uniref:hypothetical protein n=1 Tax=Winogradskyella TaxID=286104 RepID=UPI00156B4238|nr:MULTISPECIES: hypothetical protein [Winogradskyella]NRR90767.1 hypothetical protein [Winogradskyella undariae]QXP79460.1 hypothetical protein H0I32_02130 [Winogradskyella sp. HaHa_3_26]